MKVRKPFEEELLRRGFKFSIDSETGQHAIQIGDGQMLVSLENLERAYAQNSVPEVVSSFVDSIEATAAGAFDEFTEDNLYWSLEPNDYEEKAEFRVALSNRVDQVLVHLSADGGMVTWVASEMLEELELTAAKAGEIAMRNLSRALAKATLEWQEIDEVRLGYLTSSLPFKAAFIVAPNLQDVIGKKLGWPVMAVVPDRDFLYFWAAKHSDFVQRVGPTVVKEYSSAAYPISTEVYVISDEGLKAIGEFPVGED